MRRVIFEEKGGPEVLKFETLDLPSPATGEVRIKIKAIGLNRYESMFRRGVYVVPPELPSAIGAEAVGIVEALGGDISGFSVGDRVTAVPFTTIAGTGVYADTANVPTTTLLRSLDGTTDAEEAITWMAYLNAYNLLTAPRVEPGTTVLTIGATSGVGLATIQIARDLGATVIATTRKRRKAAALRDAGAHHVIVTEEEKLTDRVLELTGGRGVDLALDPVAGPSVADILATTAIGGYVLIYGVLGVPDFATARLDLPLPAIVMKFVSYATVWELVLNPPRMETAQAYIRDAHRRGVIKPVIDRTFPLSEIVAAHQYLDGRDLFGKIVVLP
jgi:NADPH:quinone reductase